MAAFDPDAYRKSVLGPVRAKGGPDASDPFELFALDPGEDDQRVIVARTADVVSFWQKERNNPKYRGLVTALLAVRDEMLAELHDPDRRRRLRAHVLAARAEQGRARFALLDAAVSRLVERRGGLPEDKLHRLRELGRSSGLSDAECAARIGQHPAVAPVAVVEGLSPSVRTQLRVALDELGHLAGNEPPASLFDLLGVDIDASDDEILHRHGELAARNRERRADRLRALIDELLTEALRHLVRNDRTLYVQAMADDVADRLRPQVQLAVLVEDELTDEDRSHLCVDAVGLGLDPARARKVVDLLAWDAGDRRWCTGGPVAQGGQEGADTDADIGPDTDTGTGPDTDTGTGVQSSPGDRRALRRAVADSRSALDGGRPAAAATHAAVAASLGTGPAVSSLLGEVQRVLDGARKAWEEAENAISARRFVTAQTLLTRLSRTASDVNGPTSAGGRLPAARLAYVAKEVSAALKLLASTDAMVAGGADLEAALVDVLDRCADLPAAMEALARLPPGPPANVRVERSGGAVTVRWEASPSPGAIDYKVTRESAGVVRTVGTTTRCSLEDGGAAPGVPVSYVVVARRSGCASAPQPAREVP